MSLQHTDFISFEYMPACGLLDHIVELVLICCRNSIMFNLMTELITFPSTECKGSLISTSFPKILSWNMHFQDH
jgi:ABC-type antimicrobial peptide transport system ATPase subunit